MMSGDKNTRALVGLVLVVVFAGALWLLLISPKRKEADELKTQVTSLRQGLVTAQGQANEARAAKKAFPTDYRQVVLLGKAVPEGSETASLLVSLNRIADRTKTDFQSLLLSATETGATEVSGTAGQAGPTAVAEPVPPTEAEAALLPLGATVGTANLGVMPYSLSFTGGFFQIANFIEEVESQIKTGKEKLSIDGRLITIDGFSLIGLGGSGGKLGAEFTVTTYLVPPSGEASSATTATALPPEATSEAGVPTSPPAAAAAATGTPSSYATGEAR
jgi:Tfp pilus assembly protein PilO